MLKRGRPPLKRPQSEVITARGLTRGQEAWLSRGWKKRGFVSAAHFLRYIIDRYVERVESGAEEDRFTPKGLEEVEKEVANSRRKR